jgi:hypothetical protein
MVPNQLLTSPSKMVTPQQYQKYLKYLALRRLHIEQEERQSHGLLDSVVGFFGDVARTVGGFFG